MTDWPVRLAPGAEVWPEGDAQPMRIARTELGGRVPVLHLEGIASREAAETLIGRYLVAPARELDPGSYFWGDLVGLRSKGKSSRKHPLRWGKGRAFRQTGLPYLR